MIEAGIKLLTNLEITSDENIVCFGARSNNCWLRCDA